MFFFLVYHDTVVVVYKMDSLLSVLTVSIVACEEDKGNIATPLWYFMKRPEYKKIMNESQQKAAKHSQGKGSFTSRIWRETNE